MNFSNFRDVIDFAIKREEEAIESYGDMLEQTRMPGLKELLSELREEEKKHKKLLQNISSEKIETLKIKDVTDLKISDYLVEEPTGQDMNFQDLLIYAAKKEKKAADLYSQLSERSEDPELKKLFDFLVQQEKSHKLKIEKEYDDHVLEWD
ncbi:MAG: ferritin family protein [Candidatus Aminicenantes bacterium]